MGQASAIVTGGASGLGAATVRRLRHDGWNVVIADRDTTAGAALAAETGADFAEVDVCSTEQVEAAVRTAVATAPLRALVNCAGIGVSVRTIGRDGTVASAHDLDLFRKVLEVNVVGTFNCLRVAATYMSANEPDADGERGVVISTSSAAAFEGQIGQAAYASSKGALVSMTLPVARDLAVVGIRVNTVVPGLVDTPIYDSAPDPAAFKAKLAEGVLFPHRLGTSDEFASLVTELISNKYMNASVVRMDGGLRMTAK